MNDLDTEQEGVVSDLLRRQTRGVDAYLSKLLTARGIDPADRTDGWEDRVRRALGDLEIVDSIDASDLSRISIHTTIRPRAADVRVVTVQDDHARMTYSPSKGATHLPRVQP